jgi:transcription initiation factor TFIIIB Brf1 subunit/transcription initiation factor TFIIB
METILCPYCECRVRVSDVDDEGGVCPECGAVITGSHLIRQAFGGDFDDEEDDDDEVKKGKRSTPGKALDDFDDDFDDDFEEDDDGDDDDF